MQAPVLSTTAKHNLDFKALVHESPSAATGLSHAFAATLHHRSCREKFALNLQP